MILISKRSAQQLPFPFLVPPGIQYLKLPEIFRNMLLTVVNKLGTRSAQNGVFQLSFVFFLSLQVIFIHMSQKLFLSSFETCAFQLKKKKKPN